MAGCGVPETTPAPENNVAICPGGDKKKEKNIYIKNSLSFSDSEQERRHVSA